MPAIRPLITLVLVTAALTLPPAAPRAADRPSPPPIDTVAVSRTIPDGGGYNKKWTGSGTPDEITFKDARILARGTDGTYCSGFTFTVAMKAATDAGLLKDRTVPQIRQFQKEWYGAVPDKDVRERQCALALPNLGIGRQITPDDARPGDFVQFWRTKSGHSAVFLGWVDRDGQRIGLKYRSSQDSTHGVGDKAEYFKDTGIDKADVNPQRMYFGRLGT